MEFDQHISDSAFLVNESRARKVDVSHDYYAKHWVLPERCGNVQALWNEFSQAVYPFDDLVLSIRNRFFLEQLQQFIHTHNDGVLVNLGAGFTSYPFLCDYPIRTLEVDFPHVTAFKKSRINDLKDKGILMDRPVEFFPADLNSPKDLIDFGQILERTIKGKPSYILMEGLTYYLNRHSLDQLFLIFGQHQVPDSIVAFDFWKPDSKQNQVFIRLQKFFRLRLGYAPVEYNLIDEDYIFSIPGYQLKELTNVIEQEERFASSKILQPAQILFENYAVLCRGS